VITTPAASAARFRGRLQLAFAPGLHGTVLARAYAAAPLKIVRPFPLAGGGVLVQVLTLGPGMCAGDTHEIDITVEPGARAVVIMQSASRLLSMPEGSHASQEVTLTVRSGGQLEYYPGLTIPFADSSFVQRVAARVETGARLGILESWSTGRSSRGEHLRFRRISTRTTVTVDRNLAYADAVELEPGVHNVQGTGVLESHRYVASGFWYGATLASGPPLSAPEGTLVALGQSAPDQVYLRALAMDGYALGEMLQSAVHCIRSGWQQSAIPFRRFTS
jgi:urease accessory protein